MATMRGFVYLTILLFFSSSLSGCLGLVVSRELMEWTRGVPETDDRVQAFGFNHTFDSADPSDILYNPQPHMIPIDGEVKEMRIFFRVQMDFSEVAGMETNNFTSAVRYVHARLWEPDANKNTETPFWEENATTEKYPPVQRLFPPFKEGVWELEVEAQGYGFDTPIEQFSFHDEFEVSVSIVRPCIVFPEAGPDDECVPV